MQATLGLNYNLIQTQKSEIYIGLSSLLRYQSASYYDAIGVICPFVTGFPYPVVSLQNKTPARTFAAGGTIRLGYKYTNKKNILFGMFGNFQMDTNSDVLSQIALTIGKRF
ncbi:MAG: hypothetical protein ABIN48_14595 [Ginsengibacter sp.]